MDDFYSIPEALNPKLGLAVSAADLETFQFPSLCTEFDHEQLLALDDPRSFYTAFPDAGVYGVGEEAYSRASSAVTPLSECSTRPPLSARNISPTSDIMPFHDQPNPRDVEGIYQDTMQSIISGRQVRAASATWPSTNSAQSGLNSTLTPPVRTLHRQKSFSYRNPQMPSQDGHTPPPPSSFFPSPNLRPQTQSHSPFLSPNLIQSNGHSPLSTTPVQPIPTQAIFAQPIFNANPSSYYSQPQSQPPPPQYLQQQFQQNPNAVIQRQLQLQQQALAIHQPHPQRRPISGPIHMQTPMLAANFPNPQVLPQHPKSLYPPAANSLNTTTTLPNTTGNSTVGYQCFSHGCGGRHFSNWGNLVRHHRERQLRSKAGAKPTCNRCGKGFTRSSARDAHVSGLKCVLGRRRRNLAANNGVKTAVSDAGSAENRDGGGEHSDAGYDEQEIDGDDASEGSREEASDGNEEGELELLADGLSSEFE